MAQLHLMIRRAMQKALDAGKTQTELAQQCGLSQGTIYKYLTGEPTPDSDTLQKFSRGLGIPIEALFISEDSQPYAAQKSDAGENIPKGTRLVPVINHSACGKWRDFTDLDFPAGHSDRQEFAPTNDQHAFYVIAAGDSMIGGKIEDGDLLLVEPSKRVDDGDIVLAKVADKGCTIKKFFRHDGHVELRPMNEQHKSLIVKNDPSLRVYRVTRIVKQV